MAFNQHIHEIFVNKFFTTMFKIARRLLNREQISHFYNAANSLFLPSQPSNLIAFRMVTGTVRCSTSHSRGLVLGVYSEKLDKADYGDCTNISSNYLLKLSSPMPRRDESRLFYDVELEGKEANRNASAMECRALNNSKMFVEDFGNEKSAAEGVSAGLWTYQNLRNLKGCEYIHQYELYVDPDMDVITHGWIIGTAKTEAQNVARKIDTPRNSLSPTVKIKITIRIKCFGSEIEIIIEF